MQSDSASYLKLIASPLNVKRFDFSKIISMFEEMVALLKMEQGNDNCKKACCLSKIDTMEDDSMALAGTVAGHKIRVLPRCPLTMPRTALPRRLR